MLFSVEQVDRKAIDSRCDVFCSSSSLCDCRMSLRGRKSRPLCDCGSIQRHGHGWRAHLSRVHIDDERRNIYGPLRDSKNKATADLNFIRDSATAGGAVERAGSLRLPAHVGSSIQRMSLCGLNVQYPWSRLIMAGRKTVEVRKYALGHYSCFSEGEQLFLIETGLPNL